MGSICISVLCIHFASLAGARVVHRDVRLGYFHAEQVHWLYLAACTFCNTRPAGLCITCHQIDPETDGPILPNRESDELKPFDRQLPEFKFW